MPTTTKSRRSAGAGQSRYSAMRPGHSRSGQSRYSAMRPGHSRSGQGRYARASAHRSQGLRRRRKAQPTGIKKMLSAVMPTGSAKKAATGSKKGAAGGLALAAAAAGMAFKNRSKLSQLRTKDAGTPPDTTSAVNNAAGPPSTPAI
jgi:hypothetical protein